MTKQNDLNSIFNAVLSYMRKTKHIEAGTKWTPFRRRHFQVRFVEWKCLISDQNFTEVCSYRSNQQYSSTGSDNGLAPTRRQAIVWSNDGYITDAYMRHSAWMSWTTRPCPVAILVKIIRIRKNLMKCTKWHPYRQMDWRKCFMHVSSDKSWL